MSPTPQRAPPSPTAGVLKNRFTVTGPKFVGESRLDINHYRRGAAYKTLCKAPHKARDNGFLMPVGMSTDADRRNFPAKLPTKIPNETHNQPF
jgi:hypothetical protein